MPDQAQLFGGQDVVDVSFGGQSLGVNDLTDCDALRAAARQSLLYRELIEDAADEIQRLRTEIAVSEKARHTLERRLKAYRLRAGESGEIDLAEAVP